MANGIFLSGATGLLGRYLLRDLLCAGRRVVVLVRPSNEDPTGRLRINDALNHFEQVSGRTLPRPLIVAGDLRDSQLGLSPADRDLVTAQCQSILHCAASVKFHKDSDHEPFRSNVEGTANLLDFCKTTRLNDFHYISTAYVCGGRTQKAFEEEIERPKQFRNDYEHSKHLAEEMLRKCQDLNTLTVYRPSIIVGDYGTGFTSTFHGFYLPLQLVYAATSAGYLHPNELGYMETLGLRGTERKNLVPVDWVSSVVTTIVQRREQHGKTYHLTNPQTVTAREIEQAIQFAIDESLPSKRGQNGTTVAQSQVQDFREQMGVYADYLSDDPEFDCQQTINAVPEHSCPRLDHAALLRLARFAIRSNFGWPRKRAAPLELDVDAQLDRLPKTIDRHRERIRLLLEVSGSGGGMWRLFLNPVNPINPVLAPLQGASDVTTYMNVYTWQEILLEKLSVSGAVAAGRVVLEGTRDRISHVTALLEALFRRLRQSE